MKKDIKLFESIGICKGLPLRISFLTVIFSFFISGCDSFTEVDLPASQLNTKAVFEDRHHGF